MKDYDNLLIDIDGAVATITFNQPDLLNPIDDNAMGTLLEALEELDDGDAVRVIRLKGAGRAFSAGGDLRSIYEKFDYKPTRTGDGPAELGGSRAEMDRNWLKILIKQFLALAAYRKPVIAQVHGYCIGGGIELIGASDVIFAAEDAKFGHPPIRAHGILPTFGGWPFRLGALKTKELIFSGDLIDGKEAERIGMINRAIPADRLDDYTMAYCQRISNTPLDALSIGKHWTNRWFELAGAVTAAMEGAEFDAVLHATPAFDEFVRIAKADGVGAAIAWRDAAFKTPLPVY